MYSKGGLRGLQHPVLSAPHLSEFSISEPRKRNYVIHMEVLCKYYLPAWEPKEGSFTKKKTYQWFLRSWHPIFFVEVSNFQIENPLRNPHSLFPIFPFHLIQKKIYVYILEKFFKRNLVYWLTQPLYALSLRYLSILLRLDVHGKDRLGFKEGLIMTHFFHFHYMFTTPLLLRSLILAHSTMQDFIGF